MSNETMYKQSRFEPGSLRDLLKRGTKEIHSVADTLFTDELVRKKISIKTYRTFLSQLYFLYSTMEAELQRHSQHPIVGPVHFPDELNRKEHIEEDLEYLYGATWATDITCLKSAQDYAERLKKLSEEQPELLIAHAYVRYLGDVSGGQILKKIIKRMYKLPLDGRGIKFYDFEAIDEIPKFKEFYSARMNSLDLDEAGKAAILEEANNAFGYNIGIFREIVSIAESLPDGYMISEADSVDNVKGCPVTRHSGTGGCPAALRTGGNNPAVCPLRALQAGTKKTAMFAVTSASTIAVLFAMMMSYCPWVHKNAGL